MRALTKIKDASLAESAGTFAPILSLYDFGHGDDLALLAVQATGASAQINLSADQAAELGEALTIWAGAASG